jgi:hypothetical protein
MFGKHRCTGADIVSTWADTQVCPYNRHMMLQNPPLGRPHWGRCQNFDLHDFLNIIFNNPVNP